MNARQLRLAIAGALLAAGAPCLAAPVPYDGSFPPDTPGGFAAVTLAVAGASRSALVYRPAGVSAPPLLLMFTGTGGTIDYNLVDEMGRDALRAFADREGVVLVAPMPRMMDRGDWDNHGAGTPYWETAVGEATDSATSADPNGNPDLLLTRALIAEAERAYGVDGGRIYSFGFSNGAFFSYFVAATLNSAIAGFAETGGGLVLDNTTAGDPVACTPPNLAGADGAMRSCSESGWTPGMCTSAGALPRPIAPGAVGRVPPGFLQANDDDNTVPWAHTCNLAASLSGSSNVQVRIVHNGGGHIVDSGFLDDAWNFMKQQRRPNTPAATPSDRIFNAAEVLYPELFAPAGGPSSNGSDPAYGSFYYRSYGTTGSYVGTQNGTAYYLLPGGAPVAAGTVEQLLPLAAGAGF